MELRTSGHWVGTRTGADLTSKKIFLSQPMAPWTSVAAYKCAVPQSMDPWAVTKKALHYCDDDTSCSPGPYPIATFSRFYIGCRLSQELFTLPSYNIICHASVLARFKTRNTDGRWFHARWCNFQPFYDWVTNSPS